ncbi:hypothetical protein QVD17_06708 [Tagetes erecta]|uniref:Uncharacterized protein n=1 Tax=Tagetes erecta TaxID=13708 RepID=A0AAD8LL63_TARER|nr:hypothetical protein QVD17_06708 [Tagetes erecta]
MAMVLLSEVAMEMVMVECGGGGTVYHQKRGAEDDTGVLSIDHLYVICFDLKNPSIVIIDSLDMDVKKKLTKAEKAITEKHTSDCNIIAAKLKGITVRYLKSVGHIKAGVIKLCKPKVLKLKWATHGMLEDSGVLIMRHMETFMWTGVDVWDCGLSIDARKLKQQILRLRKKYAAKILLSPINIHEKKIKGSVWVVT